MELIVSRWKNKGEAANCRPVTSSQLAQDREDVDYFAGARYTRDVKNGRGGGMAEPSDLSWRRERGETARAIFLRCHVG